MPTLRPQQKIAAAAICNQSHLLIADVGAGKTATVLTAIQRKCLIEGKERILVLGTVRICNIVWGEQIGIWAPGFSYASIAGRNVAARHTIIEDRSIDIVGVNFDNLIWLVNEYPDLPTQFPWLVIDESSKLENPASKSFRALAPMLPAFEWRLPMTGTPRANHLYDLWGNAYLADLGAALGRYRDAFLQNWFFPVARAVGIDWIPKHGAQEEIYQRLAGTVHRMPFEWPAPIEIDMALPPNPIVYNINKKIDRLIKDGEEDITIDGITYARNGHRISAKLLQLSSGFIYDDSHNVVCLHEDKITALSEIVNEAKGEPMMVVFQFDHERDAILARFPQARLFDNDKTLTEWNNGNIEMLLVHPLSCGYGVNAQFSGSDLQVWFTPTMDAELYTQTVGRLNRSGNSKTVRVIRLIMQNTQDRAAYMVVAARQKGERVTLDMFE